MDKESIAVVLRGHFQSVPWTNFILVAPSLEAAYDLVAGYIAKGLVLQEIRLRQAGQWTQMPVEFFTAQSLEERTQPLQAEWQAVLPALSRLVQLRWERKAFLRRQIRFYEPQLARTLQRIDQLEASLRGPIRYHDVGLNERWKGQLQKRLCDQQVKLGQLQEAHQLACEYLGSL